MQPLIENGHLWGSRLDLEGDWLGVGVLDSKRTLDMIRERSYETCPTRLTGPTTSKNIVRHTIEAESGSGVEDDGHGWGLDVEEMS